jgi:predicted porin
VNIHRKRLKWSRANMSCSAVPGAAFLLTTLALFSSVVRADGTTAGTVSDDHSLTMYGVTLYGVIDVGLQYDTHAAPVSDYLAAGVAEVIQKNSNESLFAAVPNNMGFSRIGLRGDEPLLGDWAGVFELATVFSPLSGEVTDCLRSETANNGKPLSAQTSGVDCPMAGQAFGRAAYVGLKSATFGSFTFGRQRSLLGDGIVQYDPAPSFAFSLIGFSAIPGGTGSPEGLFLDSTLKYAAKFGPLHVGALYQFGAAGGSENSALQIQLGGEVAGASVDAYYASKKNAIATASLSAPQVAALPALGYSSTNSLAATVSDNTAYAVVGMYNFGPPKLFGGYEHIDYANPSHPLQPGYINIGGYVLAFVNNTAYDHQRTLQVFWSGLRYSVTSRLDVAAAYYGFRQNSYAIGASAGCTTNKSPGCSGALNALSLSAYWRLSKRFDVYAGTMRTSAANGLASGYLNTSNVATTVGVRFSF